MDISKEHIKELSAKYADKVLREILTEEDYNSIVLRDLLSKWVRGSWRVLEDGTVEVSGSLSIEESDIETFPCRFTGFIDVIDIKRCFNLKSIEGCPEKCNMFNLINLPNLTSLKGAPKVANTVDLIRLKNLNSIEGLPSLKGTISRVIVSETSIKSLEGLSGHIYYLDLEGINLDSLIGVSDVKYLKIINVRLKTLEGLSNTECILIKRVSGLSDLKGAPKACSSLEVVECKDLTSLKGAPERCHRFVAKDLSITSLEGLGKFYTEVSLEGLKKLTNLNHTPSLCSFLQVLDMPNITSLEGIPEYCEVIDVSGSSIQDLKGIPKFCKEIVCYNCRLLRSIEDAPDGCHLAVPPKFGKESQDYKKHSLGESFMYKTKISE